MATEMHFKLLETLRDVKETGMFYNFYMYLPIQLALFTEKTVKASEVIKSKKPISEVVNKKGAQRTRCVY